MPRIGNPNRNNPAATTSDTVDFFNQADMLGDMREVFDTANRQNTSIYSVDPRGLAAFEYDINAGVGLQTDKKGLDATHRLAEGAVGQHRRPRHREPQRSRRSG